MKPSFVVRRGLAPTCPRQPVQGTDTSLSVPRTGCPAPVAWPNPPCPTPMLQPLLVPLGGWQGAHLGYGCQGPQGEHRGSVWVAAGGSLHLPTPETLSKGLPLPCQPSPGMSFFFFYHRELSYPASQLTPVKEHGVQRRPKHPNPDPQLTVLPQSIEQQQPYFCSTTTS